MMENTPLWDNRLSVEERVDYLIKNLTLEEKFKCLTTGSPKIDRLGLPAFFVGGEGAHGVQARHDQGFDKGEPDLTTLFPNPIGMSMSWDRELIEKCGEVTGTEARALYNHHGKGSLCMWAPTVDMERDPRWGRNEEAYGEDPYLTGMMAGAYARGMRGSHPEYIRCGATLKHFYANNVEEKRTYTSSTVSPRNKHEYYLEAFRKTIEEGGVEAVMASYNEINGIPAMLNPEIKAFLKDKWGIKHVVCDGGDVSQTVTEHHYFNRHSESVAAGLKAGIDCFTDDAILIEEAAKEAYEKGMITEAHIDEALKNYFGTMLRLGVIDCFEDNPYGDIGIEEVGCERHRNIAREMADEAIVLLENKKTLKCEKAGRDGQMDGESPKEETVAAILPMKVDSQRSLAVVGQLADVWYRGWYAGTPNYHITPLQGIREKRDCEHASGNDEVKLVMPDGRYLGFVGDGCEIGAVSAVDAEIFRLEQWSEKEFTIWSVSKNKLLTTEDDKLKGQQGFVTATKDEAFGWFVKERFHLKRTNDGGYKFQSWNEHDFVLDCGGRLKVIHEDDNALDTERKQSVSENALDGKSESVAENAISSNDCAQNQELIVSMETVTDGIAEAVALAKACDDVIMILGTNPMICAKEEIDRVETGLSPHQQKMMEEVTKANPNAVLVLITNAPVDIRWAKEHVRAIVLTASAGMELGRGIADNIFGYKAPAGRLNMTWYEDNEKLPDINDYDIIQHPRTYRYVRDNVMYPFGYGLTYSEMEYSGMSICLEDFTRIHVEFDIKNMGSITTDEVVQVYVGKIDSQVKRPVRELKYFDRVKDISPGEIRHISADINIAEIRYFDVISRRMMLENGLYRVEAGRSSGDIRLTDKIFIKGTLRGVRRGEQYNEAEYFDASENIMLHEGHTGVTAACTEDLRKPAALVYDDVLIPNDAENIIIDMSAAGNHQLEVLVDGNMVAETRVVYDYSSHDSRGNECGTIYISDANIFEEGRAGTGGNKEFPWVSGNRRANYREVSLILDNEIMRCRKDRSRMEIRFEGRVKICGWKFV